MSQSVPLSHGVGLRGAVSRGGSGHCPRCGVGKLFSGYLKPAGTCSNCRVSLGAFRTDDIAPYFTILVVGHVVVPLILLAEQLFAPPEWAHWLIWPPSALLITLLVLPRIKGAVLGWMWWLGIRGDERR